ncbi:MAG: transcriptional activator RfaH [Rhodospirillaceae bacterium]|nr:transcriptional activator RfaH [Rhodospirillaceae bacterium]|tara:strand:- start:23 stop:514 length:492 start_codon:yes stop_codon:yes gene_type:complete
MTWFLVYTQAQKESLARRHLEAQGFHIYLPQYRKRRRHARRIDTVLAPLFPRYLFVKFDPQRDRWRSINGTFGVQYVLSEGPQPTPIPDEIVAAIRRQEEGGIVQIREHSFKKGQRLRVVTGPFADLEGLFECTDDAHRIVLLMEFMGRVVPTRFPVDAVSAG